MLLRGKSYRCLCLNPARPVGLFLSGLFLALPLRAQSFLQRVERALPAERVRMVLYYFDTCRAVTQNQSAAFQMLGQLDAVGQRRHDNQLRRYARMLRDTWVKNKPNRTDRQNADLFLRIAQRADAEGDEQLAGVAEHFTGQYYYLGQDYGSAFQYLLSANGRFRQIGYANVPEIHRYLYELAFNYYYLNDDAKVISLLTEAAHYPAFSPNLHIQAFNTLAMAYTRQQPQSATMVGLAEANYQKAYQLAVTYRDSVWMGIVRGNLGGLYAHQGRWQAALAAFRTDYRLEMRSAGQNGYPNITAVELARSFYELNQLDSCRYYLDEAQRLRQFNSTKDFSQPFQDDVFWQLYYALARRYYQRTGNLPKSDRCADSLLSYQVRIDNRARSRDAALAEQRLLVQQHEAEVAHLERLSRTQWLLLGAGAGLTGLLGWLYWSSQRRRQQEALANAGREQQLTLEKQLVTDELDRARADLALLMEALQQKQAQLVLSNPPLATADPSLLNAHLLTNDDWAEFRRRFERVHPLFFGQLRHQFTDLTPAEERLMALSKLRIDGLHMSRMLGISPESIRKAKYRLRKKLGVTGSTPLLELLE
ncbi:hypothetical protein J2I47_00995 [Fibrella sp. HMF5335]|uniref:Tetratricopeptide repeat protein n=1 Tax=Fibrella rubiginis TaxID=2817060 RepID=A0A939K3G4_9BACT|nr:hypothetical protein [Fibrella rubiginis]MBO0935111.1 hypothetical protein [Fibrella rubiginis]